MQCSIQCPTYYVCKYTPVELLSAMGADCQTLNDMPDNFDLAEQYCGPNICGFGKSVLEKVLTGQVHELILVDCCDVMRSVYDVIAATGKVDFLYITDMLHCYKSCAKDMLVDELKRLISAYGEYKGTSFSIEKFYDAFHEKHETSLPHIEVLGARMGTQLFDMVKDTMGIEVVNETCVNNRRVGNVIPPADMGMDELLQWYAGEIFAQTPCMRMADPTGRRRLYEDPNLRGIIYHTVKFCDFYSFEYAQIKDSVDVPILKIESDYTTQSTGQLKTRLEAFNESLGFEEQPGSADNREIQMTRGYVAGIDSGSTSTDVVILDKDLNIAAKTIIPTGAGAAISADKALDMALEGTGLTREDIDATVTTGYGRAAIEIGDKSVTEISCHARGAHFLDPSIRTVIDIGGQDSKVISLDEDGNVTNFAMNDKCAAGTGRFFEMMANTMQVSLDEFATMGLSHKEDITISNTCSVFAESEVVSLIAQNKAANDIVYGLDKAVATRTLGLVNRVGGTPNYMMTGGVAKNTSLVRVLEDKLNSKLVISEHAQLCGAIGAALYAREMVS